MSGRNLNSARVPIRSLLSRRARANLKKWIVAGLPLLAIIVAGFLPINAIVRQGLVGMVMVWFQASWMLGLFRET